MAPPKFLIILWILVGLLLMDVLGFIDPIGNYFIEIFTGPDPIHRFKESQGT